MTTAVKSFADIGLGERAFRCTSESRSAVAFGAASLSAKFGPRPEPAHSFAIHRKGILDGQVPASPAPQRRPVAYEYCSAVGAVGLREVFEVVTVVHSSSTGSGTSKRQ